MNSTTGTSASAGAVLVAGAGGFIASHLVEALAKAGSPAQLLVRPGRAQALQEDARGPVVEADLQDPEQTKRAISRLEPAVIVNLARSRPDPAAGSGGEAAIASNLIDGAGEAGCERLVQLGSGLEYGAASPISEHTPLRPSTEFGSAKAEATRIVIDAGSSGGPAAVVLRPFMVYGPGEPPRHLIASAARAAWRGVALPITAPGFRRDWVFVGDVVRAILSALDGRADGEVVNLASGRDAANEEVVELVAAATGKPLRTVPGALPARPWDVRAQRVSTEKAARILGWRASVGLEPGIARTVAALSEPSAEPEAVPR